jgi:ABC-type branched-subunit amino acid transport system substrate-binding protein
LILARAHEIRGETQAAIRYAAMVVEGSDRADLRGDAAFLLGNIYYDQGSYSRSLEYNLIAYSLVTRSGTRSEIRDAVRMLCESELSVSELETMAFEYSEHPLADYLFSVLAMRASYQGETGLAARSASRVLADFPYSIYAEDMRDLLRGDEGISGREEIAPSQEDAVIGILCPLSGRHGTFGLQMRRAAELALRSSDQAGGMVALRLVDTESDPVVSVKTALELCRDRKTVALVGGISTSEVYALAGLGQCAGVPFVSPVPADPALSTVGNYVFLQQPDPESQGEVMAGFAMSELGISHFTILSPATIGGRLSREGFMGEVEKRGGRIVATQEYQEGETDFGPELKAIATSLDLFYSSLQDSVLTGIFIPAAREDAYLIAPQIRFNGIESILLGTSQWASIEVARRGGEYLSGAFAVAGQIGHASEPGPARSFESDYLAKYGELPEGPGKGTYAAVSDILYAVSEWGTSRSSVRRGLEKIRARAFEDVGDNIVGIMDGQIVPADMLRATIIPADTSRVFPYE